ncbi:hypothetical protein D9M70_652530 [compost metagenome]
MRIQAIDEVQVGMAHADSDGTNQHLTRTRLADGDIFDAQRGARLVEYGCFHGYPSIKDEVGRHGGICHRASLGVSG